MKDRLDTNEAEKRISRLNVVIVGLPGSGKTSLVDSIIPRPNYVSLGEITQNELSNNGPFAPMLRQKFKDAKPWDPEFVVSLVKPRLIQLNQLKNGFVLDGVPRKTDEALVLTNWLRKQNMPLDLIIQLNLRPELALQRILTQDRECRPEKKAHYESRIQTFLSQEEEMMKIIQGMCRKTFAVNTELNVVESAKSQLIEFVAANY